MRFSFLHPLFCLFGTGCATGATFVIADDIAVMRGTINGGTPARVAALIAEHPDLRQITLQDVPGSVNDEANIEASRAIRAAGLATHVPADGVIASGGVDLFCAGVTRTADSGAQFGVHSDNRLS